MGIRVHKLLGYGLDDVSCNKKKFRINDSRFSKKFLDKLYDEDEELYEDGILKKYLNWLKKKEKQTPKDDFQLKIAILLEIKFIEEELKKEKTDICIGYNICNEIEFGLPNVFCLIPLLSKKTWYRYDNIIDWTEETTHHNQKNRLEIYDNGIYPHNGLYYNWKTKEKALLGGESDLGGLLALWKRGDTYKIDWTTEKAKGLLNDYGFDSLEDLEKNITVAVPEEIQLLCEFLKMFKDPETVHTLKPMLYVYWA